MANRAPDLWTFAGRDLSEMTYGDASRHGLRPAGKCKTRMGFPVNDELDTALRACGLAARRKPQVEQDASAISEDAVSWCSAGSMTSLMSQYAAKSEVDLNWRFSQ